MSRTRIARSRGWRVLASSTAVLTLSAVGLSHAAAAGAVTHTSKAPKADGFTCTIWGTAKADHLGAKKAGDVVCGLGGNDVLRGNGLSGVKLLGGAGNDRLIAGLSKPHVGLSTPAGASGDVENGDGGNDVIQGSNSGDTENGGPGNDHMSGNGGNDTMNGGAGNDSMNGGAGDDDVNGDGGADHVDGGPGDDVNSGGSGDDDISDGQGSNVDDGGSGSDSISCGTNGSDDTVVSDSNDDDNQSCDGAKSVATEWQGTVTEVAGSVITVQFDETSGAGQAWLSSNGNPSTVQFDLSGANVERKPAGPIAVGDDVEIGANLPSSGTVLTAIEVRAEAGDGSGGED